MRRIILSIILGFVIPISYLILLALCEDYIAKDLIDGKFYGQSAPGVLVAPITLPVYFDIFAQENKIMPFVFDTFWFRFSSSILFTWGLYAVIAHFILGRFKRFKKRLAPASNVPPPPPPEFA